MTLLREANTLLMAFQGKTFEPWARLPEWAAGARTREAPAVAVGSCCGHRGRSSSSSRCGCNPTITINLQFPANPVPATLLYCLTIVLTEAQSAQIPSLESLRTSDMAETLDFQTDSWDEVSVPPSMSLRFRVFTILLPWQGPHTHLLVTSPFQHLRQAWDQPSPSPTLYTYITLHNYA